VHPPLTPADRRDLIALGVHALLVGHVVPPLQLAGGSLASAGTDRGSSEEPPTGAHGGTHPGTAGGGADRRSGGRAQDSADGGSLNGACGGSVAGRGSDLLARPLPAHGVVDLEDLERLAGTRQHHDART
jgi:hypothetical protein